MNIEPRTSEPRTRRTVSRWEVIAGLMVLAIPLEAVAFVGVKGLIEGGPCDDGQVLAAKVDERVRGPAR